MNIGFMQGRLSPMIDGKIQAFPWKHWKEEFELASKHGFTLMEWTLDQDRLYENPFMTPSGQSEIKQLSKKFNVNINSLTGDCFMQAPFYKAAGDKRRILLDAAQHIIEACGKLGVRYIVFPLVDGGALTTADEEKALLLGVAELLPHLKAANCKIVFEIDFNPQNVKRFISQLDPEFFGVNYDIGNSAALGFDPAEEFEAYGSRVDAIHIKDRLKGGTTVPLGQGDADFDSVFRELKAAGYDGHYILQTARAEDNAHAEVLSGYRDKAEAWICS